MSTFVSPAPEKARKYDKVPDALFKEIKRVVAVESVVQFKDVDLNAKMQEKEAARYYHGDNSVVSQVEQFISGRGVYSEMWVTNSTVAGSARVIPESLHRQHRQVFFAKKNITADLIHRASMNNGIRVSGRTIRNNAQLVTKQAKKMLTLIDEAMEEGLLEKKGGEYDFPSGKKEINFIEFLLYRMFNWEKFNGASGKDTGKGKHRVKGTAAPASAAGELDTAQGVSIVAAGDSDRTEDSDSLDDDSVKEFPEPPRDWLPVGYITFMIRGPLAPAKNRVDFLSLGEYLENKESGRKDHRISQVRKKKEERDFELGKGEEQRQSRGMALGANTQKEIALVAQNQSRIQNQAYDSEIVKHDMLIKNKQAKVKTLMEMAKMYREMGDDEMAKEEMKAAKEVLGEIDNLSGKLQDLQNGRNANSVEVDEYLRKGRIGMGIEGAGRKKAKVARPASITNNTEETKESEGCETPLSAEQLEKQSV